MTAKQIERRQGDVAKKASVIEGRIAELEAQLQAARYELSCVELDASILRLRAFELQQAIGEVCELCGKTIESSPALFREPGAPPRPTARAHYGCAEKAEWEASEG